MTEKTHGAVQTPPFSKLGQSWVLWEIAVQPRPLNFPRLHCTHKNPALHPSDNNLPGMLNHCSVLSLLSDVPPKTIPLSSDTRECHAMSCNANVSQRHCNVEEHRMLFPKKNHQQTSFGAIIIQDGHYFGGNLYLSLDQERPSVTFWENWEIYSCPSITWDWRILHCQQLLYRVYFILSIIKIWEWFCQILIRTFNHSSKLKLTFFSAWPIYSQ